ncbi:MAG: response regulator [archaeon]
MEKRILVVDDKKSIRNLVQIFLSHQGYEIITASDGVNGIREFNRGGIDLVLTDIIMPNMDGIQLYYEIRKINSRCPIYIMSGYTDNIELQELINNGVKYLKKPFKLEKLAEMVRSAFV